jgi:trk system potassium uptake protein TrkH
MGLMFIGGGTGGATGGLRITLACLLLVAVVTGGRPRTVKRVPSQPTSRGRAIALAAAMLTSLLGLVFVVSLVLMYREAGSALACAFEAVSACCNVGLSVGLTPELSVVGRLTLILAMLAGRLIPLMILLRCVLPSPAHALRPMGERELLVARLSSTLRLGPEGSPPPISQLPADDAPIPLK